MATRPLTPVQLAEYLVMVLKQLEQLDPAAQRQVLEAALATCERLEKRG